MAGRLLQLTERSLKLAPMVARAQQVAAFHGRSRIGKREVVGYGMNGEYAYIDQPEFPAPAIRYQEPTPEIEKLRQKEKGDWKNLSLEEKKARECLILFFLCLEQVFLCDGKVTEFVYESNGDCCCLEFVTHPYHAEFVL